MLEAQNAVLRRVIQDMASQLGVWGGGKPPLAGIVKCSSADGAIDFNYYLKAYIEELVAAEAKAKDPVMAPASLLATTDEDKPIIFGGNGA